MFKNYWQIAIRNLLKFRTTSIINILGLATGMAVCIIIMQYVGYEQSYDTFHENYRNIYRVQFNIYNQEELVVECAAAVPAVGPAMKENFPEISDYARAFPSGGTISVGDKAFMEDKIQLCDQGFLRIFSYDLIKGNLEDQLIKPMTCVLTETTAMKYFGDEDPIGQIIKWNGEIEIEVTGVCQDVPDNSHIKFTLLVSHSTLVEFYGEGAETAWGWYDFNTYVVLDEGVDYQDFNKRFAIWLNEQKREEWQQKDSKHEFLLQPLASIHLHSDLLQESEPEENGDADSVNFLTIIAIIILILAWVNYVNLSTSRALDRAREVGIRKVNGADRGHLTAQFMFESSLINVLALILSLIFVFITTPFFDGITGSPIKFSNLLINSYWLYLILFFAVGGVLAGLYPAMVLSSFQPLAIMKGKFRKSVSGKIFRKVLVTIQFAITIMMISGTVYVFQQLNYLQNYDLNVNISEKFVIHGPKVVEDDEKSSKIDTFREEMLKLPYVRNFSASTNVPGDEIFWATGVARADFSELKWELIYIVGMDYDYISCYDLDLIAGRNFSREFTTDDSAAIINRAAVKHFGYESPEKALGKELIMRNQKRTIVGVIDDYHQMALKEKPQPLLFPMVSEPNGGYFSLRIEPGFEKDVIKDAKTIWNEQYPGNPYNFFFLDTFFKRQYLRDYQFRNVFAIFAGLAIMIACLGLFGLASYEAVQRTKEIGIRKVLGADIFTIVLLLLKDILGVILISGLIALPLIWKIMESWIQSYPYRINLNLIYAGLSVVLALFIAVVTIGSKTVSVARKNPAEALKTGAE